MRHGSTSIPTFKNKRINWLTANFSIPTFTLFYFTYGASFPNIVTEIIADMEQVKVDVNFRKA